MESLGWRQRPGSSPAARRGARQRAGWPRVSASNILSCERETHQTSSGRSNSLDADHGIYGEGLRLYLAEIRKAGEQALHRQLRRSGGCVRDGELDTVVVMREFDDVGGA